LRLTEKNFKTKLQENLIPQEVNKKYWDSKSYHLRKMSPFWKVTSANNSHDMLKKWTNYRLTWRAKYRNWKPNKIGRSKESKKADKIKLKLWTVDLRNLKETESKQIKSWQSTSKCTRIWTNTSKVQLKVLFTKKEGRAFSTKLWLLWSSQ
jgi:hypothetical protein